MILRSLTAPSSVDAPFYPFLPPFCPVRASRALPFCPIFAPFLHPFCPVISACVSTLPPFRPLFAHFLPTFCPLFAPFLYHFFLFSRYLFLPLKYVYEYFNCFTDILVDLFFFDILLQYVSACIAIKSCKTGVSNRGRRDVNCEERFELWGDM